MAQEIAERATVTLSDPTPDVPPFEAGTPAGGAGGTPGAAATPPAAGSSETPPGEKPTEKPPEKPDPDKLILDLARRGQVLSTKEKSIVARETAVKARETRVAQIDALMVNAQTDPLSVAVEIARVLNLDADILTDAIVAKRAGGDRKLTPEERLDRMEAERRQREQAERERQTKEKETSDEAQVQGHIADLKSVVTADAAKFPLVARKGDEAYFAAFDLMVLHHNARTPISHQKAVEFVEAELRHEAEEHAKILGYSRATPPPTNPPQPTPAAPRPSQQSAPAAPPAAGNAAPIESSVMIKSDEEIARDFARALGR